MRTPESGANRFNCVTGELWDGYSLPDECLTIKYPRFAAVILSVLPAKRAPNCGRESKWIQINNSLYREVIDSLEGNQFCVDRVALLKEKYGLFRIRELSGYCSGLELNAVFKQFFEREKEKKLSQKEEKKKRRSPPGPSYFRVPLPDELEHVYSAWAAALLRRAERIESSGGKYSEDTIRRNKNEARRFLVFACECEVVDWRGVNQTILDLYALSSGTSAGQKAYTFMRYGERFFKTYRVIIRPRSRRADVHKILLADGEFVSAIRLIEETMDEELILIFYFIFYYAQTMVSCLDMKSTDFQFGLDGEVRVLLNELWIPLQGRSKEAFHNYVAARSHIFDGSSMSGGNALFEAASITYYRKIRAVIGPIIKKLRATALFNLSKAGYLDRKTVSLAFGVSMPQVEYIQRICGWDYNSYVTEEGSEKLKALMGVPS